MRLIKIVMVSFFMVQLSTPQVTGMVPQATGMVPQVTGMVPQVTGMVPHNTVYVLKQNKCKKTKNTIAR